MQTTTFSGPADTLSEARRLLHEAGYFVLSIPTRMSWLTLAPHHSFISVEGSHSAVPKAVARLGWVHRGVLADAGRAVPVGGQG